MDEGVVGGQGDGQDWIGGGLLVTVRNWIVSMNVQLIQNFIRVNITKPKAPRKSTFKRRPVPSEGKRLRFSFWWERPQRKIAKRTMSRITTKAVKMGGGSTRVEGASVMMIEGSTYLRSLDWGYSSEWRKLTLVLAMIFLVWESSLSSLTITSRL